MSKRIGLILLLAAAVGVVWYTLIALLSRGM
jgi:hypothetical protein